MKNHKGELTTQQIVTIIILVVSFSIILFFILRLNLGETSSKEICHNSVLMKARSLPGTGYLDCKTNYVCISGGDDCKDFNEDYKIKIDMNSKPTETKSKDDLIKEQIMKAIADEMADCWWMFGEGKVDYVGASISGTGSCAICSVIVFDKKIQDFAKEANKKDKITYGTLFDYLKSKEKTSKQTYLNYLYGVNDFKKENPFFESPLEFDKQQEILTGIYKKGFVFKVFSAPWVFVKSFFVDDEGKNKKAGPLTVIIQPKENIGSLGCTEFLTKA